MTQELVLETLRAREQAPDGRHAWVAQDPNVDLAAAERAAADLLAAPGIALDSEDLRETPGRLARAYAELLESEPFRLTTFANDAGYDELVLERDVPFRSVCEHHLLPFSGVAHVGYVPGERLVGLSKLARIVGHFAARPQTQERMTRQLAGFLDEHLSPLGAGVVIEAEHTCMTLRGVRSQGTTTVTSTLTGTLRADASARAEFLALAGAPRRRTQTADTDGGHRRRTQTADTVSARDIIAGVASAARGG
jgi:GTP cyclohydrolase I